eukprot:PhM_4_TR18867/c0_g1_i1/m.19275
MSHQPRPPPTATAVPNPPPGRRTTHDFRKRLHDMELEEQAAWQKKLNTFVLSEPKPRRAISEEESWYRSGLKSEYELWWIDYECTNRVGVEQLEARHRAGIVYEHSRDVLTVCSTYHRSLLLWIGSDNVRHSLVIEEATSRTGILSEFRRSLTTIAVLPGQRAWRCYVARRTRRALALDAIVCLQEEEQHARGAMESEGWCRGFFELCQACTVQTAMLVGNSIICEEENNELQSHHNQIACLSEEELQRRSLIVECLMAWCDVCFQSHWEGFGTALFEMHIRLNRSLTSFEMHDSTRRSIDVLQRWWRLCKVKNWGVAATRRRIPLPVRLPSREKFEQQLKKQRLDVARLKKQLNTMIGDDVDVTHASHDETIARDDIESREADLWQQLYDDAVMEVMAYLSQQRHGVIMAESVARREHIVRPWELGLVEPRFRSEELVSRSGVEEDEQRHRRILLASHHEERRPVAVLGVQRAARVFLARCRRAHRDLVCYGSETRRRLHDIEDEYLVHATEQLVAFVEGEHRSVLMAQYDAAHKSVADAIERIAHPELFALAFEELEGQAVLSAEAIDASWTRWFSHTTSMWDANIQSMLQAAARAESEGRVEVYHMWKVRWNNVFAQREMTVALLRRVSLSDATRAAKVLQLRLRQIRAGTIGRTATITFLREHWGRQRSDHSEKAPVHDEVTAVELVEFHDRSMIEEEATWLSRQAWAAMQRSNRDVVTEVMEANHRRDVEDWESVERNLVEGVVSGRAAVEELERSERVALEAERNILKSSINLLQEHTMRMLATFFTFEKQCRAQLVAKEDRCAQSIMASVYGPGASSDSIIRSARLMQAHFRYQMSRRRVVARWVVRLPTFEAEQRQRDVLYAEDRARLELHEAFSRSLVGAYSMRCHSKWALEESAVAHSYTSVIVPESLEWLELVGMNLLGQRRHQGLRSLLEDIGNNEAMLRVYFEQSWMISWAALFVELQRGRVEVILGSNAGATHRRRLSQVMLSLCSQEEVARRAILREERSVYANYVHDVFRSFEANVRSPSPKKVKNNSPRRDHA